MGFQVSAISTIFLMLRPVGLAGFARSSAAIAKRKRDRAQPQGMALRENLFSRIHPASWRKGMSLDFCICIWLRLRRTVVQITISEG